MQVVQPWIQKRRLAYVEDKHVFFGFLRHIRTRALGRLLTDDGELDKDVVEKLVSTGCTKYFLLENLRFS